MGKVREEKKEAVEDTNFTIIHYGESRGKTKEI